MTGSIKRSARCAISASRINALGAHMKLDRFERILCAIILAATIIAAIGQVSVRTQYNEKALHRTLQFQRFLAGEDYRGVFADHRVAKTKRAIND